MIYIFGGIYVGGSPNGFGPDFLVERDVILVQLNYRVGMFGFMSLGIPEYSGNMALKDQQLAIKWTYMNIESFGGDKHQITVSGHSAGKHLYRKITIKMNEKCDAIINQQDRIQSLIIF